MDQTLPHVSHCAEILPTHGPFIISNTHRRCLTHASRHSFARCFFYGFTPESIICHILAAQQLPARLVEPAHAHRSMDSPSAMGMAPLQLATRASNPACVPALPDAGARLEPRSSAPTLSDAGVLPAQLPCTLLPSRVIWSLYKPCSRCASGEPLQFLPTRLASCKSMKFGVMFMRKPEGRLIAQQSQV